MGKMYNVNELYQEAKETEIPLLSNFNADFWQEYVTNYSDYDKLFRRLYKSFRYFDQEECSDEGVDEVVIRFIEDVKLHLKVNQKKYEELYRIHILEDEDYQLFDNLDITRQENENRNSTGSYTSGTRQDSSTESIGAQTNTNEHDVSAFDVQTYSHESKDTETSGAQQNGTTLTKGSQTDNISSGEINAKTINITGKDSDRPISDLIGKHIKLWDNYQFYSYIFADIAKELLLV